MIDIFRPNKPSSAAAGDETSPGTIPSQFAATIQSKCAKTKQELQRRTCEGRRGSSHTGKREVPRGRRSRRRQAVPGAARSTTPPPPAAARVEVELPAAPFQKEGEGEARESCGARLGEGGIPCFNSDWLGCLQTARSRKTKLAELGECRGTKRVDGRGDQSTHTALNKLPAGAHGKCHNSSFFK